ncbi:MAG: translation initiation factor IF-2 [Caldiserica bacterium]|nr:translation initiation factor IF-2 [Caldisericota bacterium]
MAKIRIYELARNLNISSSRLLEVLKELGIDLKSHSSTIDEETARLVEDLLKEEEKKQATKGAMAAKETVTPLTVREFAQKYGIDPTKTIEFLFKKGELVTINQTLNEKQIKLLEEIKPSPDQPLETLRKSPQQEQADRELAGTEKLVPRAPVVTVLGHVDHGKTTLLDAIRKTSVAEKEKGGITQKIGASEVNFHGKKIIFIDTPGHEAFTAMRAHGAKVTDIAVLVVAADEGVMPQTVEALNHAKAAKVPIIVAVNKMDKEGANLDKVKQQLSDLGLIPEEWGGDTVFVPLSAKTGEGIDHLLEMILLLAEISELKANPDLPASGTVIEARLDKGLGPVADVIVQSGTLKLGDQVLLKSTWGKVRSMLDYCGTRLKEAGPSTPVEIIGLEDVPLPGETFQVVKELKVPKPAGEKKVLAQPTARASLEQLFKEKDTEDIFHLIIKADSQGTLDALNSVIKKVKFPDIKLEVLHSGVGAITESDVLLASVTKATIFGFNVRPDPIAKKAAEMENVDIHTYDLIYELISDLEKIVKGKLKPKWEEKILGKAIVRKVFRIPKVGVVAGSYVLEGKAERNVKARIIRDNLVILETKIASLRRFKEDVKEVAAGFECGIGLERAGDIKEGDLLEFVVMEQS